MGLTVFLLDFHRFENIHKFILPKLLQEECVTQIVIAHGSYDYVGQNERFPRLEADEIKSFEWDGKQILRIQDTLNDTYKCFRRWIWMERLSQRGLLLNDWILTHDDDFYFVKGQIERILSVRDKGLCICGSGGRDYSQKDKYTYQRVEGLCRIALGQSILLSISSVLDVCRMVREFDVPPCILHEDDIVVSFLLGKGEPVHFGLSTHKILLESLSSQWKRPDHILSRNRTAYWILTRLQGVSLPTNFPPRSHSLSTIGGKQTTSQSIELLSLSQ